MVTAPIMEYNISINNQSITVNSENPIRASFNPPFNIISGTYKSTNISLSRFEIRITAADADFDIDLGTRPYYATANISANSVHEFSFEINEENFNLGNITYRISLYARSALDGTWDVTNVLFDLNGLQLDPSDEFDGIEVYSQKEPVNSVV